MSKQNAATPPLNAVTPPLNAATPPLYAASSSQTPPLYAASSSQTPPQASTSKTDHASKTPPPPLDAASTSKTPTLDTVEVDAVPPMAVHPIPIRAVPPIIAVPVPVNSYDKNLVVWNRNKKVCKNILRGGDNFSLVRMLVEPTWINALRDEFDKEYFLDLSTFVEEGFQACSVCPPKQHVFRSFNTLPLPSVKVVILGQKEPYPYRSRAMGLAYSVTGRKHPPELERILNEVGNDIGGGAVLKGNLENWALQGVLLLSLALTVKRNKPNSHLDHGWEDFMDTVIKKISFEKSNVVFMLWGDTAHTKTDLIDGSKHMVLKAASPSQGIFMGCKHFSQANQYLESNGMHAIDWKM